MNLALSLDLVQARSHALDLAMVFAIVLDKAFSLDLHMSLIVDLNESLYLALAVDLFVYESIFSWFHSGSGGAFGYKNCSGF